MQTTTAETRERDVLEAIEIVDHQVDLRLRVQKNLLFFLDLDSNATHDTSQAHVELLVPDCKQRIQATFQISLLEQPDAFQSAGSEATQHIQCLCQAITAFDLGSGWQLLMQESHDFVEDGVEK